MAIIYNSFFGPAQIGKMRNPCVFKVGLGISRTNADSQVESTFKGVIESVFVETNQFVSNNPNVILTWKTCGQRTSMAAGSKRQQSATHFSMQIWYMFLMSKGRGERDQGLCTFPVLAKRMRLHSADFRSNPVFGRKIRRKSALHSRIFFASTGKVHRP